MKKLFLPFLGVTLLFFAACGSENTSATSTPETSVIAKNNEKSPQTPISATVSPSQEDLKAKEVVAEMETEEEELDLENIENPQPVKKADQPKAIAVSQETPPKEVVEETVKVVEEEVAVIEEEIAKVEKPAPPKVAEKPLPTEIEDKPAPVAPAFSHDAFDQLLRKHVSSRGNVKYSAFKADKAKLEAYIKDLSDNPVQNSWSRNKKMAYWINAYNAFTIKLIIDNYPVASITDLHGGKPWDVKWIKLGGKTYSLNQIENDILRPQYKDARIHFAVNCAAKSCPPLLNRAWTANNLNKYLDKQAKAFINNSQYNTIEADKVVISKIFDWYGEDFGNKIAYLNKYAATTINNGAKVTFKEYNWQLNK